jgi:dihydrofolate synthase/folylpolyglutamate synthase
MLAAIYQQAGYKTGLYTSPHLKDFRERIKINGKPISQKKVIAFVEKYQHHFEKIKPSFFEWTVGLAFDHFANEKVDVAIIEVGLGGRLDSTNVIMPLASLITNIGHDHMALLGDTLPKIAAEKAGIIKPNIPVIISETQKETRTVFVRKAKEQRSPLIFADKYFVFEREKYEAKKNSCSYSYRCQGRSLSVLCDLPGTYQKNNIAGVLTTVEQVRSHLPVNTKDLLKALTKVKSLTGLHGRWEVIGNKPRTICDTGHNKEGLSEVMKCVAREYKSKLVRGKLHVVMGVVNDKDLVSVFDLLKRDKQFKDAQYYFCKPAIPRGLEAVTLQEAAGKFGFRGEVFSSVKKALAAARGAAKNHELVFVGGSTFTVAEVV